MLKEKQREKEKEVVCVCVCVCNNYCCVCMHERKRKRERMVGGGGGEGSKQHRKKDEKIKIHFFSHCVDIWYWCVCVSFFKILLHSRRQTLYYPPVLITVARLFRIGKKKKKQREQSPNKIVQWTTKPCTYDVCTERDRERALNSKQCCSFFFYGMKWFFFFFSIYKNGNHIVCMCVNDSISSITERLTISEIWHAIDDQVCVCVFFFKRK